MKAARPSSTDVIVRLTPSHRGPSPESVSWSGGEQSSEPTRAYDAYVYTHLPIAGLDHLPPPDLGCEPFMDTPCVSLEQVVVRWSTYQDYLGAFVDGAKDPARMGSNLQRALSPGLESLFLGPLPDHPMRIWWFSETPELEDLPWELIAYPSNSMADRRSFVRGRPPSAPLPRVPLEPGAPLRLAYIHDPAFTSPALDDALHSLPPGIQLVELVENPRRALETAARSGFELVHLVADGAVSLAYEGILYPAPDRLGPQAEQLNAGDLGRILRGSRVSLLSLSESAGPEADLFQLGHYNVPSVYRAFACLARSPLPLPSVIWPLGPMDPGLLHHFWIAFYAGLTASLSVEGAMATGRLAVPAVMALYLRQMGVRTFQPLEPSAQLPAVDPARASSDLQQSYDLVERLKQLRDKYGTLPAGVEDFISTESRRQEELESDLEEWSGGEEA